MIELVIVTAVVGILVALMLVAVLASREASRRTQCINRLKQIGLALASHQAARGVFPAGIMASLSSRPGSPWAVGPVSAHAQLLPYIEQSALYDSVNLALGMIDQKHAWGVSDAPENRTIRLVSLMLFLCPSDDSRIIPGNNYRACVGPNASEMDESPPPGGGGGAFPGLKATSHESFRDGLSNTIGFSERSRGSGPGARFDAGRDFWFSGVRDIRALGDSDDMLGACAVLKGDRPPAWTESGETWLRGRYSDTLYNHVAPPDWSGPDCSANIPFGQPGDVATGAISARSLHPGGVNTLYMDGSVRFARDQIDLRVWRALASRAGGEVVSP